MRKYVIAILCSVFLGLCIVANAEQVWVKADAVLAEKETTTPFEVTDKMKTDILKLDEITILDVQKIVAKGGKGSVTEAKQAIEEMLDDKTIITKEDRYSELYPSIEPAP